MTCKSYKDTSKQTQIEVIVRTFTNTIRTFSIKIGQTVQLTPTISDSDTSKFTFNNLTSNIINVSSNGLVTGKLRGTGRVLVREEYSGAQIEYIINVLDNVAPVITVSPTSSNYVKNINVTIKATDNNGELNSSNSYQYQLGTSNTTAPTGTWSTYTNGAAVNIGQNLAGTYYLWVRQVSDKDNNISQQGGTKVGNYHVFGAYKFDNTAPTKPTLTNSSGGKWTNTGVTISAYSDDSGSGVEKIQYSFDQKTWYDDWGTLSTSGTRSSVSGTWTAQRNNTLYARAIDKMGNISEISTTSIKIDKTAPTKPTLTNSSGGKWTNTGVTISAYSDDSGSGVGKIQYSYNNSTWYDNWGTLTTNGTRSTISGTWTAQCNNTLYARAIDKVGNISEISTTSIKIDKTAPTCTITANVSDITNASSITYTFTWNEEVTGFTLGDISVTNGTKGTFSTITANKVYSLVVTNNGSCTQTVYVIPPGITDVAGNAINAVVSKSITIDRTSPTVSFGTNGKTYTIPSGNTTTISSTVTVSDTGGAGVNVTKYAWSTSNSTTPTSWTSFTNGTAVSKTGVGIGSTYYLWIQGIDKAGNSVTSKSSAFTVIEARWKNTNSGVYYNTLQTAVNGSVTGTTIQLLKSYEDTSSVRISKNLTINLAGYTLTKTTYNIVINKNYTVNINGSGNIIGGVAYALEISGTLNLNKTDSTSSSQITLTNNSSCNNYLIFITGGTLNVGNYCSINSSLYDAIYLGYSGTFNMNGSQSIVQSSSRRALNVISGIANLNTGKITVSGTYQTILNQGGTVNVQGAEISRTAGSSNVIHNYEAGCVLNIKSGKIISNQSYATVTNYGTLTMSGGEVINTYSSGGCIALASADTATISGGRIYVTTSRSAVAATGGPTYNLYQHDSGTMNITGGIIGNSSATSTSVLGNYGLVIAEGPTNNKNTVTMTGGSINIASSSTYPGRGVAIGPNSTFNLSSETDYLYGQVTAYATYANAGPYNIGVELQSADSKCNISGNARVRAMYNTSTSGYSIYKHAGMCNISSSSNIFGSTYGM